MTETLILQILCVIVLVMTFLVVGIEKYKDVKEEKEKRER